MEGELTVGRVGDVGGAAGPGVRERHAREAVRLVREVRLCSIDRCYQRTESMRVNKQYKHTYMYVASHCTASRGPHLTVLWKPERSSATASVGC